MASKTTVESETLEAFLPDLVTAICNDVQRITDQCLSNGLISDSRRRRILELKSSEDQARALIQCVQNSTKADTRCFEIFLDSLDKELPRLVKEKLLSDMRRDLAERAAVRKAIIPAFSTPFQMHDEADDSRLQCLRQQGPLFGRYESSMKKYAHASAEKTLCEQSLHLKTEESEKLRSNLESLRNQSSSSEFSSQETDSTVERLSACEMEMANLKERIEKLEGVIQEEDMQARRGKSIIMVGTKMFAKMTEEQFTVALKEKEEEYKRLLKEKEKELRRKMQEETDTKIKDLQMEHKIALQESQLQVKDLELKNASLRESRYLVPDGLGHDEQQGSTLKSLKNQGYYPGLSHVQQINTASATPGWKPEVPEAFRQLLPISNQWVNIGTLLEIPVGTLNKISADESDMHSRLRAMLIEWLKQFNPPPTWAQLADAVEPFDRAKADELRARYIDLTDS